MRTLLSRPGIFPLSADEHRTDVAFEEILGDISGDYGLEFFEQIEVAAA